MPPRRSALRHFFTARSVLALLFSALLFQALLLVTTVTIGADASAEDDSPFDPRPLEAPPERFGSFRWERVKLSEPLGAVAALIDAPEGRGRLLAIGPDGRLSTIDSKKIDGKRRVRRGRTLTFRSAPTESVVVRDLQPILYADDDRTLIVAASIVGPDSARLSIERFFPDGKDATGAPMLSIPLPYAHHGHIDLGLDPAGYLLVGVGDGGIDPARKVPTTAAQDLSSLLGAVLRLQVGLTADGYTVPRDNPFFGMKGVRGEILTYGVRRPHGLSSNRFTQRVWIADCGARWDELQLLERGANLGWGARDGLSPTAIARTGGAKMRPAEVILPHGAGTSRIGGAIIRGERWPKLASLYVFERPDRGETWAVAATGSPRPQSRLAESVGGRSFALDSSGELYTATPDGKLFQLTEGPAGPTFPLLLSQTGLFDPQGQPIDGAIRYAPRMPAWSDGARTERFLLLPPGESLELGASGAFEFPRGSVLVQTHGAAREGATRRIETRILVRSADGWRAERYRWNDDQSDATWLAGGTDRLPESVRWEGGPTEWTFPTTDDCVSCHSDGPLGLTPPQLGRTIDAWRERGIVAGDATATPVAPERGASVDAAELDRWVRSYLDVNCAGCHSDAEHIDLRAVTPLAETGLLEKRRYHEPGMPKAARRLVPGDPDASDLFWRVHQTGAGRMPRVGSHAVDTLFTERLREWIERLDESAPK